MVVGFKKLVKQLKLNEYSRQNGWEPTRETRLDFWSN